jgi:hypothetical protein
MEKMIKLNIANRMIIKSLFADYQGNVQGVKLANKLMKLCALSSDEMKEAKVGYIYQCKKCEAQKLVAYGDRMDACAVEGCGSTQVGPIRSIWQNDIIAEIDITDSGYELIKKKLTEKGDIDELSMDYAEIIDLFFE